jgi:hypothetical protein
MRPKSAGNAISVIVRNKPLTDAGAPVMPDLPPNIAAMIAGAQPVKWGNTFESPDGALHISIEAKGETRRVVISTDRQPSDGDWADMLAFIQQASAAPTPQP